MTIQRRPIDRVSAPNSPARCPVPMPVPTRAPVPLGRSSQSARVSRQPGELVRTTTAHRIAAREPARATNAGGAAARDECVGHARGRSIHSLCNRLLGGERRPRRPSLLARCAALNQLLGRTAAAPRRGRPVRALGQRPARARPDAPLGCRGADHAASITVRPTRLCRPPPPCTWRRPPCSGATVSPGTPTPTHPPHPTPTPPTTATTPPACLSPPSRRAPCHRPASLDRSTGTSSRPLPTQTPPLFCPTR